MPDVLTEPPEENSPTRSAPVKPRVLTMCEFAENFGIGEQYVHQMVRDLKLEHYVIADSVRITNPDFDGEQLPGFLSVNEFANELRVSVADVLEAARLRMIHVTRIIGNTLVFRPSPTGAKANGEGQSLQTAPHRPLEITT